MPLENPKASAKLTAHRGQATWGEQLVPLERFRRATSAAGRRLDTKERAAAKERFLCVAPDGAELEGPFARVAVFGGVYSNHQALAALLDDANRRGALD